MYDDIYKYLITNFYRIKMSTYIVSSKKEYIKRLINGEIDEVQKKIYESNCFSNRDFVYKIVSTNSLFFEFIDEDFKNDYYFVLEIMKENPNIYRYVKFKEDDKIIRLALKNPFMLQYAGEEIKDNEKYAKLTMNEKGEVICYASERLRKKYGEYSSSWWIGLGLLGK